MKKILIGLIFLAISSSAWAGSTTTLTTQIPAPFMDLYSFRLNPATLTDPCTDYTFALDESQVQRYCLNGTWSYPIGIWTHSMDIATGTPYLYPTDTTATLHVGIGTGTTFPLFKLTLDDDGSIMAGGLIDQGNSLTDNNIEEGTKFFWYVRKGSLMAGYLNNLDGDYLDDDDIGRYSVALGESPLSSGDNATVLGGKDNHATAGYTAVVGGNDNEALGIYSSVGGGVRNTASGDSALVGGGGDPTAEAARNTASGNYSVVVGGLHNTASETAAFVGGGDTNTASGADAVVSGGFSNTASGAAAAIAGGDNNLANGQNTSIGGGSTNTIDVNALYATIGGGQTNSAGNDHATVAGGHANTASGLASAVLGGDTNTASGDYSAVLGGHNNSAQAAGSSVLGENLTVAAAATNSIAMGNSAAPLTINTANSFIISGLNLGVDVTAPVEKVEVNGWVKFGSGYYTVGAPAKKIEYRAIFDASGNFVRGDSGVSAVRTSAGVYTITHPALTSSIPVVTPVSVASRTVSIDPTLTNTTFTIRVWSAGVLTDTGFAFSVSGTPAGG